MSHYLKADLHGTPSSLKEIEVQASHLKSKCSMGIWVCLASLVILLIPRFIFFGYVSPHVYYEMLVVSGILAFLTMATGLGILMVYEADGYYSPVDKDICVDILALSKKHPVIKEYCIKVSNQGRQILFYEYYAMCAFDEGHVAEAACKELYSMTADS